jgi:hypothetical protein
MIDRAEIPAFDLLLDHLHVLASPSIEDHPEHSICPMRGLDDLQAFL